MSHRIVITALSPLSFPPRKPGTQFTPSLRYVPGGVLWGAVGALLGETPKARFGNALPARVSDQWVRLLPATAMSCKNNSGFKADGKDGIFDTLIDRACWEALQPAAFTYNPQCPVCLDRAKSQSGFYAHTAEGDWRSRTVQHRIVTRVAIDRKRSTASEAQLYSPIVISEVNLFKIEKEKVYEETTFVGEVWALDEQEQGFLKQVSAVGGRRSSGLGQVQIVVQGESEPEDVKRRAIKQRVADFQTIFKQRWQLFESLQPQERPDWTPERWHVFTIGLQSNALLLEHGWQPTMVYSAAQLKQQTGLDATLIRSQATSGIIGGWNVSWDRPKATMLSANAGSVYLFRTQASLDDIANALSQLEERGIGERRQEGYGAVRGCDEFHRQATKEVV